MSDQRDAPDLWRGTEDHIASKAGRSSSRRKVCRQGDVSAVRALWGTTQRALKGILVRTSSFGSGFIAGRLLTLLNSGELLQIHRDTGLQFRI